MKNSRESNNNNKPRKEIIMNIPKTNKPHRNHAAALLDELRRPFLSCIHSLKTVRRELAKQGIQGLGDGFIHCPMTTDLFGGLPGARTAEEHL